MKILVTGNAGSGKTTFSKRLSEKLAIEQYNLDRIVWKEGWKRAPRKEKEKQIAELTNRASWIIDGVSYDVMDAAEQVIFLDFPKRTCYWRVLGRTLRHLFSQRPEMPARSPEILIIPRLIKIIWLFHKNVRPNILEESKRRTTQSFIHIKSRADLDNYFEIVG